MICGMATETSGVRFRAQAARGHSCPQQTPLLSPGIAPQSLGLAGAIALLCCCLFIWPRSASAQTIGNHPAVYDSRGILQPWTSWRDALDREVNWYLKCPWTNGYPRFVVMTFMDGSYNPRRDRPDCIPAMQNGMGIISYLKYYAWSGRNNPKLLDIARAMGDFLVKENLTPDEGKYPRFPRSTGHRFCFPQPPDCGSQADHPYEIQPDKGGIAGYALVLLYEETKDERYLRQALQTARVLSANMGDGTDSKSPWPFRADYRTGAPRGDVASNQSFTLRLFDQLVELGHPEFKAPREKLWAWIKNVQIPNASRDGMLWVQFFEDYAMTTNRNSWAAYEHRRATCASRRRRWTRTGARMRARSSSS